MSIIKYLKQMLNGVVWAAGSIIVLTLLLDRMGILLDGLIALVMVSFMAGAFGYYLAGGEKDVSDRG